MKRIILEIDQQATFAHTGKFIPIKRFVARTDKICGCQEFNDGAVKVTINQGEDRPLTSVIVVNSFDDVAEAML